MWPVDSGDLAGQPPLLQALAAGMPMILNWNRASPVPIPVFETRWNVPQ